MERNCMNCKFDRFNLEGRMIQCFQGHVRIFKTVVENCHAWGEKPEPPCWCSYPQEVRNNWNVSVRDKEGVPNLVWKIVCCPVCGKARINWGK